MATKPLENIFLSASIPLADRNPIYYETADVIAIRDAVIGLAMAIVPKYKLIWGGHPSITPIIRNVLKNLGANEAEHMELYQSRYFEKYFPKDNNIFSNIKYTKPIELSNEEESRNASINEMREEMLSIDKNFKYAIYIGGMEGIKDEYKTANKNHPNITHLPIASTGAAARILYDELKIKDDRLVKEYAYMSLFEALLV